MPKNCAKLIEIEGPIFKQFWKQPQLQGVPNFDTIWVFRPVNQSQGMRVVLGVKYEEEYENYNIFALQMMKIVISHSCDRAA